jgi:hypothetical protein
VVAVVSEGADHRRWTLAYHESAHVVTAWLLGQTVLRVSIHRSIADGCAVDGTTERRPQQVCRHTWLDDITIMSAGHVGELVAVSLGRVDPGPARYVVDDSTSTEDLLAGVGRIERAPLFALPGPDGAHIDEMVAEVGDGSTALADAAKLYGRALAYELLTSQRGVRLLTAVALALVERGTLQAAELDDLLEADTRNTQQKGSES